MTLEEFLKSLKKGECKKCETTDDCHRVIKVFRFDDGTYTAYLNDNSSRGVYRVGSIENVLKEINDRFFEHWTEFDYEVFKDREELKEENAQLKKALKMACGFIEGKIVCSECPFDMNCNKDTSRGDCIKILCEYFLEKAKSNEFR